MEKIANIKDIGKGASPFFDYRGTKAILIRTNDDEVVAYIAVCPHEGGALEWDQGINKILCECHLSLFNVHDGSVYRHSSLFELEQGLTGIEIKVDADRNIYAL